LEFKKNAPCSAPQYLKISARWMGARSLNYNGGQWWSVDDAGVKRRNKSGHDDEWNKFTALRFMSMDTNKMC
jgi:hypothetical protein